MSVKRILFVDNPEPDAENFGHLLNNLPEGWESEVIASGSEALELTQNKAFDVIVSETRLPDMSGIEFLKKVTHHRPGAARFILSNQINRDIILQGSGYVHQFIAKPCKPDKFLSLLNNSVTLREILSAEPLQSKITTIEALPSPPQIYNQLIQELQSDNASLQKISGLIKQDISITAKLMQVVNSAFFGLSTKVNNPLQAVNVLGLDTVKSLVMAAEVFNKFDDSQSTEFSIDGIFNRSVAVGAGARLFATALGLDARTTEDALLGGMLHDIGKLVMLTYFGAELDESARIARENSIPLYQAEKQNLGVDDAEVGAYLLSLWGISDNILESTALHYQPNKSTNPVLNVLACVHLAYAFDQDNGNESKQDKESALDMDYLQKLGLSDQIEDLHNLFLGAVT